MNDKQCTLVSDYYSIVTDCKSYDRYPNITDREKWDALPLELKNELVKRGEDAQKEEWTQLTISDFREFFKTGNRVRFEEKYFPRRRKLNKLVMAECVENKGRFVDDILDGLYLILEETTWCLPPHNSYKRDAKQENIPDVTRPIIDLFQAESGAEVAFAEYLMRPVFAEISPYISDYVNERLNSRIFEPYLKQHFWWMGNGSEPMCNWTPWCTQNVLIAALTRKNGFFTTHEKMIFMKKAARSCDYFLDGYGEDGGCNEGAQYYSHAGLCLFGCLELISGACDMEKRSYAEISDDGSVIIHGVQEKVHGYEQAALETDHRIDSKENFYVDESSECFGAVFKEPIIRNIANFIVKMHVAGDYYINFADCSAHPGRRSAREFLFGKAVGDEVLSSFSAEDFRSESMGERLLDDEINLFYHCMQAFAYEEMMNFPKTTMLGEDAWFESMGLMVARDDTFVLAAKAGNNADSHNHNDVGSFTIYKNGKPFIIDLGVGTYTQKTFSDKRYEIWTMQSQFHNVPTFVKCGKDDSANESGADEILNQILENMGRDAASDVYDSRIVMQKDGENYSAGSVVCILDGDGTETEQTNSVNENAAGEKITVSSLKMDISGAYFEDENDTGKQHYNRKVSLYKGEKIVVEDEYDGDMPFVASLMTYGEPVVEKSDEEMVFGVRETSLGEVGKIVISGAESFLVQKYPITDERLKSAWKHEVYRILIRGKEKEKLKMCFE
ncbi:heparinase II/III domain-containing protein [Butyrivibrio sp. YAB3001]|uniref:heparinase II/III domain-containing protein n=1 Tax=Butyrivibrio sp. YAB3001 TaxID=1520812 RepID=UPI0008F64919|nr:heparinase II/III family protein [Butyrivibrio sp. YAB3001]SFC61471.1 Heparinase II/III-like protein [Butyrivibrio sp. YAB3001]